MRISYWSSDVCSSDLLDLRFARALCNAKGGIGVCHTRPVARMSFGREGPIAPRCGTVARGRQVPRFEAPAPLAAGLIARPCPRAAFCAAHAANQPLQTARASCREKGCTLRAALG